MLEVVVYNLQDLHFCFDFWVLVRDYDLKVFGGFFLLLLLLLTFFLVGAVLLECVFVLVLGVITFIFLALLQLIIITLLIIFNLGG